MTSSPDPRPTLGLRPIVNAAGTETVYGAAPAIPAAIEAASAILPFAVEIADLQRAASCAIARASGAEAGFVTASAASGVTLSVAAAMTGCDLAHIERLPDARGLRRAVLLQGGHAIDYGAPLEQAIRLAGAEPRVIGQANLTQARQMEAALDGEVAAILHVVSHHCAPTGGVPLAEMVGIARAAGVPVIVDAASEDTFPEMIAAGADLTIVSAHKFLGGLTAGLVMGRKAMVRASYLQNAGIGRGMKVGKEGIAAGIAALDAWRTRDREAVRAARERILRLWEESLAGAPDLRVARRPDPTGNDVTRLRVEPAPGAPFEAFELVEALGDSSPPVMVRAPEIDLEYFELDPTTLNEAAAPVVAEALRAALRSLADPQRPRRSLEAWRREALDRQLAWPD